ncbi:hypothetical protein DAPPUDRAFT_236830 [Daphnia pulex]|uniref:Uncharacterized protein n=1 Tax=Daphnia pulex TaxID=6669 RepID=E9G213_DAPPU|nr:hypothetical protein DAPPUDRAFT_236830 [Daphnia pulex]|eukprot:EFX86168.1 hypothetical protein DAPPUDRAFT_236830 [Daphnia pulex]
MKEEQGWSGSRHCITELRPIWTLGNHPNVWQALSSASLRVCVPPDYYDLLADLLLQSCFAYQRAGGRTDGGENMSSPWAAI